MAEPGSLEQKSPMVGGVLSVEAVPRNRPAIVEFGRLAVKHQLMSAEQLKEALSHYKARQEAGERITARQLLISGGYLTPAQFDDLLTLFKLAGERPPHHRFGELALEQGDLTPARHHEVVAIQQQLFAKHGRAPQLGAILVKKGYLTPERVEQILALQRQRDRELSSKREGSDLSPSQPSAVAEAHPVTFEIELSEDSLECHFILHQPYREPDGLVILLQLLSQARVIYGLVDQEWLRRLIRGEEGASGRWMIAKGRPAVPGVDGRVRYLFDTDPLKVGTIKEGGRIDFKDRGKIPMVKQGEPIAELIAPVFGEPGCNIFGKEIAIPKVHYAKLTYSKGVKLSADKTHAEATVDGTPAVTKTGVLYVFSVHQIEGDIGYKSGHVDFDGDIQVEGSISNGFKVKGGRLTAREISMAEIEIRGDILIQGGIIGAKVKCGGNLRAHFIHNAELEVSGDVVVDKEVIGSTIHSGGGFFGDRVTLLNSTLSTCGSIAVKEVGAEGGAAPNMIYLSTCSQLNREIESRKASLKALQQQQQSLTGALEELQKEHQSLTATLSSQTQLLDRERVQIQGEMRQLDAKFHALKVAEQSGMGGRKLKADRDGLQLKIVKLESQLEALFDRQEQLKGAITTHQQQLTEQQPTIELIQSELEVLLAERSQRSEGARLEVHGTLYEYNQIHTSYKSQTIQAAVRRVALKSVKIEDEVTGAYRWELITVALTR